MSKWLGGKPHFWVKKDVWIASVNPETVDYNRHRGRHFWVFDPETKREIKVEALDLKVNIANPRHIQIDTHNEKSYVLPAIDFYYQLEGERAPKDAVEYFDQLELDCRMNRNHNPFLPKGKGLWIPPSQKR